MAHCLVVGGTGMLRGVCVVLAEAGHRVSVVARNKERLVGLVRDTQRSPGVVNPIPVDYLNNNALHEKLSEAIAVLGPISLSVLWIHGEAGDAPGVVARLLNEQKENCQVYHVLGSTAADPTKQVGDSRPFEHLANCSYHRITLGFRTGKDGSRWLTNDEIAQGVLDAIANERHEAVVGEIEPWENRPGR
ncbi:short-chain dehydrogenase [candidate division GN15 bacterium]|nr:short-chain dehydrogenase [candidate division GN15 bacterium]